MRIVSDVILYVINWRIDVREGGQGKIYLPFAPSTNGKIK
jgi:hypothetical protein